MPKIHKKLNLGPEIDDASSMDKIFSLPDGIVEAESMETENGMCGWMVHGLKPPACTTASTASSMSRRTPCTTM